MVWLKATIEKLLEMARSMMKGKSLPNTFWDKSIVSSIYFFNICSTRSVENMTPQHAQSGEKPGVAHLKVFGCIYYSYVPAKQRKKTRL